VQVNDAVAAELRDHVIALTLAHHPGRAVDAYAGRGDTAVPLASAGVVVTAIELDRDAAAHGARRLSSPSRMIHGRVEDEIARSLPADVVLVNPPRAGLHERVGNAFAAAAAPPGAVIYVSCNPATLARDIARMPGYHIASIVAFDMFPQTAHVETVCELVRDVA
jgi:23S rRNA (uracil1939-C5)-methyltransferase